MRTGVVGREVEREQDEKARAPRNRSFESNSIAEIDDPGIRAPRTPLLGSRGAANESAHAVVRRERRAAVAEPTFPVTPATA